MINDKHVIDGVVHCYDFSPSNLKADSPVPGMLAEGLYQNFMVGLSPTEGGYVLDRERFMDPPDLDLMESAIFEESQNDAMVFHEVPLWGMFRQGVSPLWVGEELRRRRPGRVFLYGGLSPWRGNAVEELDRLVEESQIVGVKLYPMDIFDGGAKSYSLEDPEFLYPVIERAQSHGIKSIAIHKALPLGPVSMDPFRMGDVEHVAMAFPEMNFEIVHGGFAFLEETAAQMARFPNVWVNLENTSAYLARAPYKFLDIVGELLAAGGQDRIIWGTGCPTIHPRPLLEAFDAITMPRERVEQYGWPELDGTIKAKILGENFMRLHGFATSTITQNDRADQELARPWSALR